MSQPGLVGQIVAGILIDPSVLNWRAAGGVLPSLVEDSAVMVKGLALPDEGGSTKVFAQSIIPLELARVPLPSVIAIRVSLNQNGDKAQALNDLFTKKPGTAEVRLKIEKARDFLIILDVKTRVRADKEFRAEVERICGPESLEILASGHNHRCPTRGCFASPHPSLQGGTAVAMGRLRSRPYSRERPW